MTRTRRIVLAAVIAVPVGLVAALVAMLPRWAATSAGSLGPPLRSGERIYLLSAELRPVWRFSNRSWNGRSELLVDLHALDAATLTPIYRERVETRRADHGQGWRLLGAHGELLWLLSPTGPFAVAAATGRVLATPEALAERNPPLRGMMPTEERYYRFGPEGLSIYAADARNWYIHPQSLEATAAPAAGVAPAVAAAYFTPDATHAFTERGVQLGSHWLGVLNAEEARRFAQNHTIGGTDHTTRRSLYAADITQQKEFLGPVNRYAGFRALTGDFLAPGLLAEHRPTGPGAIVFRHQPESVFVLHRDRLGEAGRLQLARVAGPGGEVRWNTPVPLSILQSVLPGEGSLVLFGRRYLPRDPDTPGDPYHSAREVVVALDWGSGALHTFELGDPVEAEGKR